MLVIAETSDNTEAWYDFPLPWLSKTVKAATFQKAPEIFYCSKAAFDLWATRTEGTQGERNQKQRSYNKN